MGVCTHLSSMPLFSDDSKFSWKESFFLAGSGAIVETEDADRLAGLGVITSYVLTYVLTMC